MVKNKKEILRIARMNQLHKIGEKYRCELFLPPFQNRNNPFYLMDDIKNDAIKFHKFLIEIQDMKIKFKFHDNGKTYMEILGV